MKKNEKILAGLALSLLLGFSTIANAKPINGTNGDDMLDGTAEADVMNAKAGDDQVRSGAGDDQLNGGEGNDFLFGDVGDDSLNGGPGDDLLRGATGSDVMRAGDGNDVIDMHVGFDSANLFAPCRAVVAEGFDVGHGGDGDDTFRWASGPAPHPFAPISFCLLGGDGVVNGGDGYDVIFVGLGDFVAESSGYVIEEASEPGYDGQLRSLLSGATLQFKGVEEIRFADAEMYSPF